MTRESFLRNIWQSYPPAPADDGLRSWYWGRWLEPREGRIVLQREGGRRQELELVSLRVRGVRSEISEKDFLSCLRPGDLVAVRPSVETQEAEILLLAPCHAEPPDLKTLNLLEAWKPFERRIEDFFLARGFLAARTPTLVPSPGTEPHLHFFRTELVVGSRRERRYLPPSPELSLKKMLAAGVGRVFEIRPCFRNGEISPSHQPEFLMLEWYRSMAGLDRIRRDLLELLSELTGQTQSGRRVSVADLFRQYCDFNLEPSTPRQELLKLAGRLSIPTDPGDDWNDLFFRIFVDRIEPFLETDTPLFVENYPPTQAALARLTPDGWGDRFELYWHGHELVNAYHELTDPVQQAARIEEELEIRRRLGREEVPVDRDFIKALEAGVPPCAGAALGLERLFMALHRVPRLSDLRAFSERDS